MSKRFLASVLGLLALLLAAGTATAAGPPGVQTAGQTATSGQEAAAASGATQVQPSNTNISVRVLSPGNGGSVSQTNAVDSSANAANSNSADQNASQSQGGAGGIQTSTQSAGNAQLAGALSTAAQFGATNTNLGIRVGSEGNDGNVSQTNDVSSDASSTNDNRTKQEADQSQAGGSPCGCDPGAAAIQTADQSAASEQKAGALSAAEQKDAANVNLPIRVGSSGNDGSVSQTNSVASDANAHNANDTQQSSDQSQGGGSTGTGVQTANQSAGNEQAAAAASHASQEKPKNVNISVRVLSPGDDGSVSQTNSVSSSASASNDNHTHQGVEQDQSGSGAPCGCGGGSTSVQTAQQSAANEQASLAGSSATQIGAKNVNQPIRVGSEGNGGAVTQSNDVSSEANASNDNDLSQHVSQDPSTSTHDCGCAGPTEIQTATQQAENGQAAVALSKAEQDFGHADCGCAAGGNSNKPVRVGSPGDDGSVSQSNDVSSSADASNRNHTGQDAHQDISGASGTGVQIGYQSAESKQLAAAASAALQRGASNDNAPVRVGSAGNGGSVTQSNDVSSEANATNGNYTRQDADQNLSGRDGCGCAGSIGIQALGQKAESSQGALALSGAAQVFGRSECGCGSDGNSNRPVRVWSGGNDGSVSQSNTADSNAAAGNWNSTHQSGDQTLTGGSGIGIQALGQEASNRQAAAALSAAFQLGASNGNSPVRVYSPGGDGSVAQTNAVSSAAKSWNANGTKQDGSQTLRGSDICGCGAPIAVQALGQSAASGQLALGFSKAAQLAPRNANGGTSVWSPGDGGSVRQLDQDSSVADALNRNWAEMLARQSR